MADHQNHKTSGAAIGPGEALAPYRHTEIVQVEECRSCALQAKRRAYAVDMTKAIGLPIALGGPWALVFVLALPQSALAAPMGVLIATVFIASLWRGLGVADSHR